jgi:hypothetical protein
LAYQKKTKKKAAGLEKSQHSFRQRCLQRVTKEEYIHELGPAVDILPDVRGAAKKDREERDALYRRGSYSSAVEEDRVMGIFSQAMSQTMSKLQNIIPVDVSFRNPVVFKDQGGEEYVDRRSMVRFIRGHDGELSYLWRRDDS